MVIGAVMMSSGGVKDGVGWVAEAGVQARASVLAGGLVAL